MDLHWIDLTIIAVYLLLNALIGVYIQKKSTKGIDSFFLADRNVPLVDARTLRMLKLYRYRRNNGAGRRNVLSRCQKHLDDAYILGMAHHMLLHGIPG